MKPPRSAAGPPKSGITVRPCAPDDMPAVARLAARLVREHHAFDPDRFMTAERIEEGYAAFLCGQLENRQAVVLVADQTGRIAGYIYGRIEPRDWNALRDRCGVLHDLYVEERARGQGVGTRLIREAAARLAKLGAPRLILMSAARNTPAHRLFERLGFRVTMVEMTRECPRP